MNTRLAVASHILTFINALDGQPATSEAIAASVNTNPTLVRRLLSQMNKAQITRAQMGTGGGSVLARPPDEISLLDVYRAVDGTAVLSLHESPSAKCPVGRSIKAALQDPFQQAQQAFERDLAGTSIAELSHRTAALTSAAA